METVEAIGADAPPSVAPALRHDWSAAEVEALLALPFAELMFRAQTAHRRHFDPNQVQMSTLLSIKTGGCPEDCAYCPQSARYDTGLVAAQRLMSARRGAGRSPARPRRRRDTLLHGRRLAQPERPRPGRGRSEMVAGVKALGMETCVTLGMLSAAQAERDSPPPASTSTTTISTRRRRSTAKSSRRGPTRTGSRPWATCATRASTSAAAASSAWANRAATART